MNTSKTESDTKSDTNSKPEYETDSDSENDTEFDVPDELDIILHTSVPLLGKFYYSPDMSIKNENLITQKDLIFNPLIKLDPNSLKDIPDYEQRVSHFFNRTSYESMVYNYSSMSLLKLSKYDIKKKTNSLQYNDNINNNLTFVLDTIFEPGQTFYLGGKSFTILFYNLKSNKPRITNKIGTITADPNQTIYDTRKKLRKKGKENKAILDKLQEDTIDDIDDVIDNANETTGKATNFFNDLKNKIPYFKKNEPTTTTGGGSNYYHSLEIDDNFQTKFNLNDDSFLKDFSKFISIQINNYNIQHDDKIVYLIQGIWHGIDNISTTNSIFNLLKKCKKKNNPILMSNIADSLLSIGIHLVINNENTNNSISDTHLSLYLKHNLETNMVTFEKSANHMSGGRRKGYYDLRSNEDYIRNRSRYYNPYLSPEDFEKTSLNKYEIEVYVELTNKKLSENETNCYMKKRKMIYNAKELFSSEKLFDFTKISNSELYDPSMDLSKIRPYLDLSYNTKISDKKDKDKDKDNDKDKKENKDKKDKDKNKYSL
jgi:hypothetical protein